MSTLISSPGNLKRGSQLFRCWIKCLSRIPAVSQRAFFPASEIATTRTASLTFSQPSQSQTALSMPLRYLGRTSLMHLRRLSLYNPSDSFNFSILLAMTSYQLITQTPHSRFRLIRIRMSGCGQRISEKRCQIRINSIGSPIFTVPRET